MNHVQEAANKIGSQAEMARQLGVTYQVISKWVKQGYVPASRAAEICRLSGVHWEDLSPDFDWPC